jgi:hypothetical protein
MVERRRFTVHSTPTAELKQILDGPGFDLLRDAVR